MSAYTIPQMLAIDSGRHRTETDTLNSDRLPPVALHKGRLPILILGPLTCGCLQTDQQRALYDLVGLGSHWGPERAAS